MRFGSVLCLPVWSFDGPSRQDGVSVVRFANLYWLVTVSGFQGSSCSGFPTYPAVLSAARRQKLFRRRGGTLRIRLDRVNSSPEHFPRPYAVACPATRRRIEERPRLIRKALAGQHVGRVPAAP